MRFATSAGHTRGEPWTCRYCGKKACQSCAHFFWSSRAGGVKPKSTGDGWEFIGERIGTCPVCRQDVVHGKRKKVEPNALTSDKDLQKIIRAAEREGWTVEVTGGGHLVFKSSDRGVPPIYTAKSPSDWRGLKNLRSTLKRHGLVANVFPESVHATAKPARAEHRGVAYLVERMPDGEWRWETVSTTGYESSESGARDAARRTIERRLAARSM